MSFQVPASILMGNAPAALAAGEAALAQGETSFDFSGLQQSDSSAVAVCLAWRRAAQTRNLNLNFLQLPASLKQLATAYGVSELLQS